MFFRCLVIAGTFRYDGLGRPISSREIVARFRPSPPGGRILFGLLFLGISRACGANRGRDPNAVCLSGCGKGRPTQGDQRAVVR